ncbi:MAG: replication-relaxation family protein [Ktedonobacterales bacterium]|nr:replication-relaxation family protein [Ktedonobacterales bacterium]
MSEQVLSPLDEELLRLLLLGPFQRAEDLARLLGQHANLLREHLAQLSTVDLVQTITPGFLGRNSGQFAYLTSRGIAHLARLAKEPRGPFAKHWQVDLAGLARHLLRLPAYAHLQTGLPDLLQALGQALREHYAPQERTVPWYWLRDYHYSFRQGHTWTRVATDGLIIFRPHLVHPHGVGLPSHLDLTYAVWLLLDPGIGEADTFTRRLIALLKLRERRWIEEGIADFPPLIIYASSPYRAAIWRRAARGASAYVRAEPLAGMIQIASPLSTDWWPPGILVEARHDAAEGPEWSDLVTGNRSRLAQIFAQPLAEAALPPAIEHYFLAVPVAAPGQMATVVPVPRIRAANLTERLAASAQGSSPWDETVAESPSAAGDERSVPSSPSETAPPETTLPPPPTRLQAMTLGHLALNVTRRQIQALAVLAAHPVMPLRELSTMLAVTPETCRTTHLLALLHQGLIAPIRVYCPDLDLLLTPPPSAPANRVIESYQVSAKGVALLSHFQHLRQRRGNPTTDPDLLAEGLTNIHQHNIGLYHFFARLIAAAREQTALHRLLWWETGAACVRRYAQKRHPDGTIVWGTIRPDAIAEYAWGTRHLRFWLEWDMGTMGHQMLLEKLLNYTWYAQTRALYQDAPRSLPVLFIVVPEYGQELRIARILQELIDARILDPKGNLMVRTTTFALLAEAGPLAPIWRPQLPQPYVVEAVNASIVPFIAMLDQIRPLPLFVKP